MQKPDDVFIKAVNAVFFKNKKPKNIDKVRAYMKDKLNYIYSQPLVEPWLFQESLLPALKKLAKKPELGNKLPELGSLLQYKVLPVYLQQNDLDSDLSGLILPTKFPPAVDASIEIVEKEITVENPTIPKMENCVSCFGRKWISTGLYAKQGELITVTVPKKWLESLVYKLGLIQTSYGKRT